MVKGQYREIYLAPPKSDINVAVLSKRNIPQSKSV